MEIFFVQNTILSLIVTGITFLVLELLRFLNGRNLIGSEVSRKVVHLGAGTLYLATYFYDDRGVFSKYMNVFPSVLWTGIILWKSQRRSHRHQKQYDFIVDAMARTGHTHELLRGPLIFNIVMIICGTCFYKTTLASLTMGILTWGDGFAAIIGVRYGSNFKIYHQKTFAGLVACFCSGLIGAIIYSAIVAADFQFTYVPKICVISLGAAVVETLSPSDLDNLTIALSVFILNCLLF